MKWLFPLAAILNMTQTNCQASERAAGPNSALSRLAPSLGTEAAYLLNNEWDSGFVTNWWRAGPWGRVLCFQQEGGITK